jgi:hypothetical protein
MRHDSGTIEQQQRQGSGLTRERDKRGRGSGGRGDREAEGPSATENTRLGIALHRRKLQRKAEREAREREAREGKAPAIPREGGAELAPDVRSRMQAGLGAPIPDGVKVHTGGASGDAAKALGARAFTDGADIHFAPGQFAPGTPHGDHLLAHELAHTIQGGGGVQRKAETDAASAAELEVSQPGDAAEVEADQAADAATAALHGGQRAERPRIGAQLGGVGRKLHLSPEGDKPAPETTGGAQKAAAGGQVAATPDVAKGPPEAGKGSPGTDAAKEAPAAQTWPQAKAMLMAGEVPPPDLLPGCGGVPEFAQRMRDIQADDTIPPEVRADFMAELRARVGAMEKPPENLFWDLLNKVVYGPGGPDRFQRKGKKLPSADWIKQNLGPLQRAVNLRGLLFNNTTKDFWDRASELDKNIPDGAGRAKADYFKIAPLLVQLVKTGKLPFSPDADLDGGSLIKGGREGASGWFFSGNDAGNAVDSPQALQTQLAVDPSYAEGYLIVEVPPEVAAPGEQQAAGGPDAAGGKGQDTAARRPTALDLCLMPEGKLNENKEEPVGRTNPTKEGQKEVREVVLPPLPLSIMKRGPFVMG